MRRFGYAIFAALLIGAASGCFGPSTAAGPNYSYQPPSAAAFKNPAFNHTKAELEQFLAKTLVGYQPEGTPIQGRLESFQSLPVNFERGRCYMMVLKLDDAAKFSAHAQAGIDFKYIPQAGGAQVSGGPGIHGPGGYWGAATDKSKVHELGQGAFTLQLYSKPISEEHLGAQKADQEKQLEESREFQRQEDARKMDNIIRGCQKCAQAYNECLADWRRGASRQTCANEYRSCVWRETQLSGPEQCPR
jgi:hypothetical protein